MLFQRRWFDVEISPNTRRRLNVVI